MKPSVSLGTLFLVEIEALLGVTSAEAQQRDGDKAEQQEVLAVVRAARITGRTNEPGGTIRVSVPVPLGRIVGGSVIATFRRDLPGVRLEIRLSNSSEVDLVRDRLDLAIRGGVLPDSNYLSRRLARVPMWLYASAHYHDRALDSIPIIAAAGDERLLSKRHPQLGQSSVFVDDRTAVVDALRAGAGLGVLPAFLGEPARAEGSLFRFDSEPLHTRIVHAVYLPSQRDDLRVRVLLGHLTSGLRTMLSPAGDPVDERDP